MDENFLDIIFEYNQLHLTESKIRINFNFNSEKIFIELEADKKSIFSFTTENDLFFLENIFLKILEEVVKNNELVSIREILADNGGTCVIANQENTEEIVLRNCPNEVIELIKKEIEEKGEEMKSKGVVQKIKAISENSRPDFSSIINNPVIVNEKKETLSLDTDDEITAAGEEQAKMLFQLIQERDQIKKDAEEFALAILKSERERKEISMYAEEQARRILDLIRENEKLRILAEENARMIFEEEMKNSLNEVAKDNSILLRDFERISFLINSLTSVMELDFAVNHPTVMQLLVNLEDKAEHYLKKHPNIIMAVEEPVVECEVKEQDLEELLRTIKHAYVSSRMYEKDGRHTLINIEPEEDSYRVILYSIKNESADVLTDISILNSNFTDDTIKSLCDIYSENTKIVASKTDNIPGGLADYLVIDNKNNAIKYMGCPKEIIEIAKKYL